MFSDERKGVVQLLHQIVKVVEQKAIEIGFEKSKAFAGGSFTTISPRSKWRTSYTIIAIITPMGRWVKKRVLLFKIHAYLILNEAQDIVVVEFCVKLGISRIMLWAVLSYWNNMIYSWRACIVNIWNNSNRLLPKLSFY